MADKIISKIAQLNDTLRQTFLGGRVLITRGLNAITEPTKSAALAAVQNFADFNENNDPHGEHDCASIDVEGLTIFFKVDYYDPQYCYHSEDPADPTKTRRVLTIMLADEY